MSRTHQYEVQSVFIDGIVHNQEQVSLKYQKFSSESISMKKLRKICTNISEVWVHGNNDGYSHF